MTDLVNHNNNNTTTDVSSLSTPDTAVTDKVYFRPALFYQIIQMNISYSDTFRLTCNDYYNLA